MKILVIHNILWSHYKAIVFNALDDICRQHGDVLLVIQIAESERGRRSLGPSERKLHRYPLRLLFDGDFETTGAIARTIKLCREIVRYRPDIIVLPGYSDVSHWCALLVASFMQMPRLVSFDSTAIDHHRVWHKELVKKLFVRMCNGGFGYGTKSKEYLVQLGMPPDKFFVRYQATHNQEIAATYTKYLQDRDKKLDDIGAKKRNFIYVGRLSREKNIELLLSAYARLKRSGSAADEWGLIVVGDGPLRQSLEALKTADTVFVGGKSWREVPEYYALADVFILPSTSETWGLVVNEAMICGLPVIVSNRCGSAHDLVIEGKNGFSFDPYSEDELLDRMRSFIEHPNCIREMGFCSQKIIRDYTPLNAARQMHDGLHAVFGSKDAHGWQRCK